MIEIIKELNIEVSKPNVFQAVVAKQYDMNTRFIKATFVDGGNKIFIDPESTVKVIINALRPDGESQGFEGEVEQDGTVKVPLHSWMLELDGTVVCDISVIDTEKDDNKKLTTTSFTLLVEKAAYGGEDITSDPQYDILVQLLETCSEAGALAEDALQKSKEANSKYDACVEATQNANQAAAGVVTIEQNNQTPLKFWVGTQAEYEAIAEPEQGCFYIVENDDTYGLGGEAQRTGMTDLNDIKITGWFRADVGTQNAPIATHGTLLNVIASDLYVVQIAYIMAGNDIYYNAVARRSFSVSTSTWGEWEYENPMMKENVEYRTCERYLEKPVYTKIVSISTSEEKEGEDESPYYINAPHGIENFGTIKSASAILKYGTMSTAMSNLSGYVLAIDSENVMILYDISIATDSVGGNAGTIYVELKYTKE